MILATILFSFGVAQNVIHPGSIPLEWIWAYRPLEILPKLWLPVTVFLICLAAFFYFLYVQPEEQLWRRGRVVLFLIAISLLAFLLNISVFPLAKLGFDELPLLVIHSVHTSYFTIVPPACRDFHPS